LKKTEIQPVNDKTNRIFFSAEQEVFSRAFSENHPFRKIKIIDFAKFTKPLRKFYFNLGTNGITIEKGFKALIVQF